MKTYGKKIFDGNIIEEILISLPKNFDPVLVMVE